MQKVSWCFYFFILFSAFQSKAQTPVEKYGKLKLNGLQLSSECGAPVQLKGMSSYGLQYAFNCVSEVSALAALKNDWGSDIFRIALYTEEGGYITDTAGYTEAVNHLVDIAEAQGLYCLIDWHILKDGNPMKHIEAAKIFWDKMSRRHNGKKHIMYEICNEPNGAAVTWPVIKSYAEIIIPIIRKNDTTSIIVVGTPGYSSQPGAVVGNELIGDLGKNVMYAFHFYSASHSGYIPSIKDAVTKVPVFATEWGGVESSGKGVFNESVTNNFLDIFNGNNSAGTLISWCNWSYGDFNEGSSVLLPNSCQEAAWNNTSPTGTIVKKLINTPDLNLGCSSIPQIYVNPKSVISKPGQSSYFISKAYGADIKYQWQYSKDSLIWSDLQGRDTFLLKINNIRNTDDGFYRSRVTGSGDTLFSNIASLKFIPDGPFLGKPIVIPGKVEAENYDEGARSVVYEDSDPGNNGGALRIGDVDVETTRDTSGGYNVGWISPDEFLTYTVDVKENGVYDFNFRIASNATTPAEFSLSLNDVIIIPSVVVNNTGNWQVWKTLSVRDVQINAGIQALKLNFISGGMNFNFIYVQKSKPQGTESDNISDNLEIFPNPSLSELNVNSANSRLAGSTIEILNNLGQIVKKLNCFSNENKFDVSQIKNGVYTLKVSKNNSVLNAKWIKL